MITYDKFDITKVKVGDEVNLRNYGSKLVKITDIDFSKNKPIEGVTWRGCPGRGIIQETEYWNLDGSYELGVKSAYDLVNYTSIGDTECIPFSLENYGVKNAMTRCGFPVRFFNFNTLNKKPITGSIIIEQENDRYEFIQNWTADGYVIPGKMTDLDLVLKR